MDKDQDEYKNALCGCTHTRDSHNSIEGYCCICNCKDFAPLQVIVLDSKPVVVWSK